MHRRRVITRSNSLATLYSKRPGGTGESEPSTFSSFHPVGIHLLFWPSVPPGNRYSGL